MAAPSLAALLLVADGRLPTGGHAHSGGMEEAVAAGRVRDTADLSAWLVGRLATAGRVDPAVAVAARAILAEPAAARPPVTQAAPTRAGLLGALDGEAAARVPSPALRRAARAQGRSLWRTARRCWPGPELDALDGVHPDGPFHPVALGAVGAVAGLDAAGVAAAALWSALSGPAWAAVRLLGLDPLAVAAVLAGLTPSVDAAASDAVGAAAAGPWPGLPAAGAPLGEIGAEHHAGWEVRLFAS